MEKEKLVAGAIGIAVTTHAVVIIKAFNGATTDTDSLLRLALDMDLGVSHQTIDLCAKEYPWKK